MGLLREVLVMRTLIAFGLLAGLTLFTGCASTISKTEDQRKNAYKENIDNDFRQIGDDWDMAWLADRPGRLTRWYTR